MNVAKPDGRKVRRSNNKQKTIETVLDMILETGEEPGINAIVERSGISRRSVFYYFNNREMMINEINNLIFIRINKRFRMPPINETHSFKEVFSMFIDVRIQIFEYIAPLKMIIEEKKRLNTFLLENTRAFNRMEEDVVENLFASFFRERPDWPELRTLLLTTFSWNTWSFLRYDRELGIGDYRKLIEKQITLLTK